MSRLLELVEELVNEDSEQKLIVGNISRGWKPVRNPKSKYFIRPAQYKEETYPDFATGPSYLVSRRAVEGMVEAALGMLYIHLEDVFLTGILAQAVGLRPKDHPGFSFKRRDLDICSVRKTITTHGVSSREMVEVWRKLKEGEGKDCPGGRGWAARTHLTGDC